MDTAQAATSTTAMSPSKSHYVALDGLRGIASLMVVAFHLFEPYSHGDATKQIINHGNLAVDFFFMLSGFVIAYAYDDRWSRMTQWDFYKRRLIRLQPMVLMGSLIGAALFYFQAGPPFPLIAGTPAWKLLFVMVVGCTLLPLPISMDIRGWQEMHPLDGPAWSLFYEYIANILYALGLRRLSKTALGAFVVLTAAFLVHWAVLGPQGDLIGGWSLDATQLHIGFARLLFPFLAGVFLCRLGANIQVKSAFGVAGVLLIFALSLPRFGGTDHRWMNGVYEAVCVIVLFPIVVAVGASEKRIDGPSIRIARFFGDLSFPLYITHYPFVYLYTGWVRRTNPTASQGAVQALLVMLIAVAVAYASLKLYDEPMRRWLSKKFLRHTT
jgi:peptidoglycan/LPS O-acetylase OafA/YrhL